MKYGVISFSYENYEGLENQLQKHSVYTTNLGDNMQSVAVRYLLRRLGINDSQMIDVDRDTLSEYDGPPVKLIMNGVFNQHSFPLAENIEPIFVGFHADRETIKMHRNLFYKYQPIGCRDYGTKRRMEKNGINAYVSGCITLTFPKREPTHARKLVVVYGSGSGKLPTELFKHIPEKHLKEMELIFHRVPATVHPLPRKQYLSMEQISEAYLNFYKNEAGIVLTSLHHAATPCLAMGIPTIICREKMNERFDFVKDLIPIYTKSQFHKIDWLPRAIDCSSISREFEKNVKLRL